MFLFGLGKVIHRDVPSFALYMYDSLSHVSLRAQLYRLQKIEVAEWLVAPRISSPTLCRLPSNPFSAVLADVNMIPTSVHSNAC